MRFEVVSRIIPSGPARAPVLVLLGWGGPAEGLVAAAARWPHILLVPGPDDCVTTLRLLCKQECRADQDIRILDNCSITLGRTLFYGSTMWSAEKNRFWWEEDRTAVARELRSAAGAPHPVVVLSYFQPDAECLEGVYTPRAWFYGDREAPISGCYGDRRVFVAGGREFEAPFEYH